jgi:hypothetical protein
MIEKYNFNIKNITIYLIPLFPSSSSSLPCFGLLYLLFLHKYGVELIMELLNYVLLGVQCNLRYLNIFKTIKIQDYIGKRAKALR